jgi:hypothetical protein
MKRNIILLFVIFATILAGSQTTLSIPSYLTALQSVYGGGSCGTCHVNPSGGGARNAYGTLFENQPNHAADPISALKVIGAPPGMASPSPSPSSTPISGNTAPLLSSTPIPGATPILSSTPISLPGIGGPTISCYVITSNGTVVPGTATTSTIAPMPMTGTTSVTGGSSTSITGLTSSVTGSTSVTGVSGVTTSVPVTGPVTGMISSSATDATIKYKEFTLLNNKWGQPAATQSIFSYVNSAGNTILGWSWNNPGTGYNYPEFVIGTHFGGWPSTSPSFPIQYKNVNTWTVDLAWDYPQPPTGSFWDLGFDIYWMDSSFKTKNYNIMIWPHSSSYAPGQYVKDVSDGFNTYAYYHGSKSYGPWDAFVLKNQPSAGGSMSINIKALINTISNSQFTGSGEWYIPDIQLGSENQNSAGKLEISKFDMNLNGNIINLNTGGTQVSIPNLASVAPNPTSTPVPNPTNTPVPPMSASLPNPKSTPVPPMSTSLPTGTVPTVAELLAKIQPLLVPANRINANTLVTSYGTGAEYIYKLPGTNPAVLVAQSSGAVDCDGQKTAQCSTATDQFYQSDTSFHQSNGAPLNAATLPFYVLPVVGPYFDYTKNGIQGGQLGAIIYNNNMNYGVFGDECAVNNEIGEISYAMASSLGINPDPAVGGTTSGVTFIIFTGTGNVVSPIESHTQATTMGSGALATLWAQLGG